MEDIKKTGLSRRTIVKGAAWSVPVIAAAVAVPMAAASGHTPNDMLNFYVTAFNVNGGGSSFGQVEANGIRMSPVGAGNEQVAVGSVFTITIEYHGNNNAFDFTTPLYGVDWNKAQNVGPGRWDSMQVTKTKMVLTWTSTSTTAEPTAPAFTWQLGPAAGSVVRPGDNEISVTGIGVLAKGGDFPNGGSVGPLTVDPNAGTGTLTGPGLHGQDNAQTWP